MKPLCHVLNLRQCYSARRPEGWPDGLFLSRGILCFAGNFDKPSMIPEGEVKLAPQARPSLPAADETSPHGEQAWLSRDAPYDRMTGMVRTLSVRARGYICPKIRHCCLRFMQTACSG